MEKLEENNFAEDSLYELQKNEELFCLQSS